VKKRGKVRVSQLGMARGKERRGEKQNKMLCSKTTGVWGLMKDRGREKIHGAGKGYCISKRRTENKKKRTKDMRKGIRKGNLCVKRRWLHCFGCKKRGKKSTGKEGGWSGVGRMLPGNRFKEIIKLRG